MSHKDAEQALANRDRPEATVDREPRAASVMHSIRFPAKLSKGWKPKPSGKAYAKHRRFAPARRHGVRLTRPTNSLSLQVIR